MATLTSYLNDTRRLLHDARSSFYTDADLTVYINSASRRVVADSTCYRRLQTIYLSTGLEVYGYGQVSGCSVISGGTGYVNPTVTFSAPPAGGVTATGTVTSAGGVITDILVSNGGSGYTSAPTMTFGGGGLSANVVASVIDINTLDTINITLIWGSRRLILDRASFTQFQATVRGWVGLSRQPCVAASYGQNQWYIGPIPNQSYVTEWDTVVNPADLVNFTDVSVISYPYTEPVSFYAAHLAKLYEQSHKESEKLLELYQQKMRQAIRSAMMRKLPSAYG